MGRLLGRGRGSVERQLARSVIDIDKVTEELRVLDEQTLHMTEAADDARLRSLVSDNPGDGREHRHAAKAAAKVEAERAALRRKLVALQANQDKLLDRLARP